MANPVEPEEQDEEQDEEEYEPDYGGIEKDPETLFRARYIDSLFDTTLFLRRDGRRRGLWVWLEEVLLELWVWLEEVLLDARLVGFEAFKAWLEDPTGAVEAEKAEKEKTEDWDFEDEG